MRTELIAGSKSSKNPTENPSQISQNNHIGCPFRSLRVKTGTGPNRQASLTPPPQQKSLNSLLGEAMSALGSGGGNPISPIIVAGLK